MVELILSLIELALLILILVRIKKKSSLDRTAEHIDRIEEEEQARERKHSDYIHNLVRRRREAHEAEMRGDIVNGSEVDEFSPDLDMNLPTPGWERRTARFRNHCFPRKERTVHRR